MRIRRDAARRYLIRSMSEVGARLRRRRDHRLLSKEGTHDLQSSIVAGIIQRKGRCTAPRRPAPACDLVPCPGRTRRQPLGLGGPIAEGGKPRNASANADQLRASGRLDRSIPPDGSDGAADKGVRLAIHRVTSLSWTQKKSDHDTRAWRNP